MFDFCYHAQVRGSSRSFRDVLRERIGCLDNVQFTNPRNSLSLGQRHADRGFFVDTPTHLKASAGVGTRCDSCQGHRTSGNASTADRYPPSRPRSSSPLAGPRLSSACATGDRSTGAVVKGGKATATDSLSESGSIPLRRTLPDRSDSVAMSTVTERTIHYSETVA